MTTKATTLLSREKAVSIPMFLTSLTVRKQWKIPWGKNQTCSNSFRRFIASSEKQHVTVCRQLFVLVLMVVFAVLVFSQTDSHYIRSNYRKHNRTNDFRKWSWNQLNDTTDDIGGCNSGGFNVSRALGQDQMRSNYSGDMGNTALCESLNHICNNERSSNSLSQSLPQVKVKIAITFGFFFQISNKGVNYWLNHKFAVVFCSDKKEGIIRVVLKETLSGRKVGQREYASVDGLEKFLFLVFNMVVLNGSFNLAEVKKVVVLAVYSAKKKSGSNIIAVVFMTIQIRTGYVTVVHKLAELKDRRVSGRMTMNTPNWCKSLLLPVSRFW